VAVPAVPVPVLVTISAIAPVEPDERSTEPVISNWMIAPPVLLLAKLADADPEDVATALVAATQMLGV
jgi:hypothetical protein